MKNKMSKDKFKHYFRIKLDNPLSKHDIRGLISVIEKTIPNVFNPLKEGTAVVYRTKNEAHFYDFKLDKNVTEAEAEIVFGLISEWTKGDFEFEITTTEKYNLPEGELEADLTAMKHNQWIQKQVDDGWRYGLVFNENLKTDPRLRPYHELTEKLKNI
jgi:hypothetical protein